MRCEKPPELYFRGLCIVIINYTVNTPAGAVKATGMSCSLQVTATF